MSFSVAEIEKKLGYTFKNKALLEEAFTHSTYAHVYNVKSNERLEYLGDTVLQLVVTEYQFKKYPAKTEGELTFLRQKLVCEDALYEAVRELDIEEHLLYAGSGSNIGKKTVSSLFETVLGALYLDGGYEAAKAFVMQRGVLKSSQRIKDAKTQLQEYLQSKRNPPPVYEEKSKSGKDNEPVFVFEAHALGKSATGIGRSKRQAQQEAAAKLLQLFKSAETP